MIELGQSALACADTERQTQNLLQFPSTSD